MSAAIRTVTASLFRGLDKGFLQTLDDAERCEMLAYIHLRCTDKSD